MSEIPFKIIQECVKKGQLYYSPHSIARMAERYIDREKVKACILTGKLIELQDHGRDIKVVIQKSTSETPEFYVVVAACYPRPHVITVCRTMEEVWECIGGVLKRRRTR